MRMILTKKEIRNGWGRETYKYCYQWQKCMKKIPLFKIRGQEYIFKLIKVKEVIEVNSTKELCLQDSFGSRRAARVAPVRPEAVPASEPISVGSGIIPLLHKTELFSNVAGSTMISYLWKDKKYTAAVSERSKKMWEKQPCRHQSERRRKGEGAPGTGSVSPAAHGRTHQVQCPHCSL